MKADKVNSLPTSYRCKCTNWMKKLKRMDVISWKGLRTYLNRKLGWKRFHDIWKKYKFTIRYELLAAWMFYEYLMFI